MPPTTVAKAEAEKNSDSILSRLDESLAQYHEDVEACEELAFRTASSEELTVAELNMFRLAGFIERVELNKFMGRCHLAKGHISKAGPKGAFEDDKNKLLRAEAAEKEQRPLNEEKIRELQEQMRGLKRETVDLRFTIDSKTRARKNLLDLSPPQFAQEAAHLKRAANLRYLQEISDLETQLKITDLVQEKGPSDDWSRTHCMGLGASHPCYPRVQSHAGAFLSTSEPAWAGYRVQLQAKRGKIETRLAEIKPEYAKALEEAEAPLYYYHRKFGL